MIRTPIRRIGVAAVAVTLALTVAPFASGTAHALSPLPITCDAAGTVLFTNGAHTSWQVLGRGSCQGDLGGTYFLDFTGTGTSDPILNCDTTTGGVLIVPVTNLDIHVIGTLTNAATLIPKALNQHWVAPLTTYPVATPFLVDNTSGGTIGAGVFFNNIFFDCVNNPVAKFAWGFLT